MLPINKMGDPTWNLEEIRNRNLKEGRPTNAAAFFFFQNGNARTEYVGEISPGGNDAPAGTLIVTLTARATQDDSGFPELLLSDKVSGSKELSGYAWAKYQQGKLVNQSGNFNYYLTDGPYMQYFRHLDGMRFVSFDDYLHLFYRYDKNLIIISSPRQGLWVWVTLFSYLFTFFSIAWLLFTLGVRFVREGLHLRFNFNSRIQITIVMIVVGTLLLIGLATVTYIIDNYEQAQNNRIREKLNNIRVLAESELGNRNDLGESLSDDLQFVFSRLSRTLRTDFNIYNEHGQLCFTSQPGIYDQEIMAPLMNRNALIALTTNQKALAVQRENIGNLHYTAAYEPLRNSSNKNIGFLSLPYFDKDNELKRDISGFLVALINLYVLLFSISTLVAFFISNRITQPLRIIQESLRKTKLGTTNEPIVWRTKDEIGALINEYNRMVNELQRSAELLAKSERESAWREMAKQVAHEIKNPLTPMKLGIQHLQRAINDNHPNKEELVRKITNTMIEQIDTLSNIATEFSHFAKLPKPEYTGVELISILQHTIDLYEEDDDSDIVFESHPELVMVRGDKDQLIRIFSNLIKNALQAIPPDRKGLVRITLHTLPEGEIMVAVKDNGIGIPKDQLSKIFVPNFTTKSSGTGLGLAMVKAMAEGMGGSVWFETEEGTGTVFFVQLVKEITG
jgi:signal transduction histidine kinase